MKGATDARGDDISDMKYSVAEWLNQSNALEATERLNAHDRTTRGLQHDVTGKLLCPIEFDWDDLEYVSHVQHSDTYLPQQCSCQAPGRSTWI